MCKNIYTPKNTNIQIYLFCKNIRSNQLSFFLISVPVLPVVLPVVGLKKKKY